VVCCVESTHFFTSWMCHILSAPEIKSVTLKFFEAVFEPLSGALFNSAYRCRAFLSLGLSLAGSSVSFKSAKHRAWRHGNCLGEAIA
jgi:hypothetical protein